jgi:hypothetical protein
MEVFCDPVLIRELEEPGSDVRHGVNLIARPPRQIMTEIERIQEAMRRVEPDQYYYPLPDLHVTAFEIAHSVRPEEAEVVAKGTDLRAALSEKTLPSFVLYSPTVMFRERGTVLRFEPDEGFSSLRAVIANTTAALGISVIPRDTLMLPHVTFMRYLRPLTVSDSVWLNVLRDIRLEPTLTWAVKELWMTWGATWFGMRSRIREHGPYPLS